MSYSMRRLLLVLLAVVPTFAACAMTRDLETLFLPDRERWTLVNGQDDGHQTIAEYVPAGQTLAGWRELITIQALDDRRPVEPPMVTMTKLRDILKQRGGEVEWNVIEEDAHSVLYEWTIRGAPGVEDQGEIARLVQGKDALHRAAYSYKSLPLAAARRAERTELLRNARVVKGEKERLAAMDEFFPGWQNAR